MLDWTALRVHHLRCFFAKGSESWFWIHVCSLSLLEIVILNLLFDTFILLFFCSFIVILLHSYWGCALKWSCCRFWKALGGSHTLNHGHRSRWLFWRNYFWDDGRLDQRKRQGCLWYRGRLLWKWDVFERDDSFRFQPWLSNQLRLSFSSLLLFRNYLQFNDFVGFVQRRSSRLNSDGCGFNLFWLCQRLCSVIFLLLWQSLKCIIFALDVQLFNWYFATYRPWANGTVADHGHMGWCKFQFEFRFRWFCDYRLLR